jgi:transcriptional regulator with XRE-family HTH domain
MQWNAEKIGHIIQTKRLGLGWSIDTLHLKTGLKTSTISRLEHGRLSRPPERATQAKLEEVFGVKLPIVRVPPKTMCVYVSQGHEKLLGEVRTRFPKNSMSLGLMKALAEWVDHRNALDKWEKDHPKDEKRRKF